MRSLLFAPGISARMLAKAVQTSADVVIFDLEDSVPLHAKAEARGLVKDALARTAQGRPKRYVRINPFTSPWWEEDLHQILPCDPDGIMLPKPDGPEDVARLGKQLDRLEGSARAGQTRIIAICSETAEGTLSLAARSWRHPRLAGLLWGAEDLATAIGAAGNRGADGQYRSPFGLARNLCLLAARAAGVEPIDAVYTDIADEDGLAREAAAARRDGFSAKAAIHPRQVEAINLAFSFSQSEREWALRVIEALQDGAIGVAQLDGVMIDLPHLAQARRILASGP